MKHIKEVLKYVIVFIVIVFFATILLTLVASIPRKYVEKNLRQAVEYFKENNTEIRMMEGKNKGYAYIHTYGEEMLFNIIYCLDTNNPLQAVMEAKFYERFENEGSNIKYIKLVQEDLEPNAEYMRYWHGSMIFIKPLLMFFTLEQINLINGIVLLALTIILLAILIKKKYYAIAISFIIGFIMTACWYVPFSFEFVYSFYAMLICSIIAIKIEDKNLENKNKKLYMLFFVTGILTSFFDFLSAEILTILVPVLIIVSMRIKNKNLKDMKKEIIFLIVSLMLWGVGYCIMFLAKWIVASFVLGINAFEYSVNKAMIRVNGQVSNLSMIEMMWRAITSNFKTLYFINGIQNKPIYLITILVIIFAMITLIADKKDKKKMQYLFFMLIIALVPYIRFAVLANHSIKHMFMTFRCQLPTIMCIVLILINTANKEMLFSDIKKEKK